MNKLSLKQQLFTAATVAALNVGTEPDEHAVETARLEAFDKDNFDKRDYGYFAQEFNAASARLKSFGTQKTASEIALANEAAQAARQNVAKP